MNSGPEEIPAILLTQLGREQALALMDCAEIRAFDGGTVIVREGQPVGSLYAVLDGVLSISVEDAGRTLQLGRIGRGKWFGELSLLTGEPAAASVTAETPATLLELSHALFDCLLTARPELANAVIRVLIPTLAERLRASNEAIAQGPSGTFALPGSATVAAIALPRNWLKTVLRKLAGLETS
jgi:CRP-like cAMP-binding protein